MIVDRRGAARWLVAAIIMASSVSKLAYAQGRRRAKSLHKLFRSVEIEGDRSALLRLEGRLAGFAVERVGQSISLLWLQDSGSNVWAIGVNPHDLQFKFEVFGLAIETLETLQARAAAWKPPPFTSDVPEKLRALFLIKPPAPVAPAHFQPWPFSSWRTDVLRRAEYIVEDVDVSPTIGDNSNLQSALPPGKVPPEASASCEVAVGLLFTAQNGNRMLIGADWMPMNLIVSQDHQAIEGYVSSCEAVALADYAKLLEGSA